MPNITVELWRKVRDTNQFATQHYLLHLLQFDCGFYNSIAIQYKKLVAMLIIVLLTNISLTALPPRIQSNSVEINPKTASMYLAIEVSAIASA
jgi:hypothetical protein